MNAILYNTTALNLLGSLEDETVDLVLSDPPYLISHTSNRRVKQKKFKEILNDTHNELTEKGLETFLGEAHRVLKNDSHIYIFCSWKKEPIFRKYFEQFFTLKNVLIWDKGNHGSGDLKGAYGNRYELILFGHKGRLELNGKRFSDIITDFPKIHSTKLLHPHQKPISLLETLILKSSDEGGIVVDPYAGVGSTLIAAKNTKRKSIGSEIDRAYYNEARILLGEL